MRAILVVVREIRTNQPLEVSVAHDDNMVEELAPATSDPTLRHWILPRAAVRGAAWLDAHRLHEPHDCGAEDRIAVEDEILRCGVVGKGLAELLNYLGGRRVEGRIEV